jgi:hypothetical protein
MDSKKLTKDCAVAERYIAEGQALIDQQRRVILDLVLSGGDFSAAVAMMRRLLESQRLQEQHYHRILIKLARPRSILSQQR